MQIFKPDQVEGTREYSGVVKFIVNDSPDYSVGQFILNKGDALGPEFHDNDETFYVIAGTIVVEEVGKGINHQVNAGELIVLSAGEEHRVYTTSEDHEAFVLWFTGKK